MSVLDAIRDFLARLFGPRPAPRPATTAELAARLRLELARDIAELYAGERGESGFVAASRGLTTGRQLGASLGGALGLGPIAEGIGAGFGALFGAFSALVEKENLRARFNDWARSLSPVERYLAVALLRPMVTAARARDRLAPVDRWRTAPGGFKTVGGPLADFPGHFNLESLVESSWPEPPPAQTAKGRAVGLRDVREQYIRYALAVLGASENDEVRLNHPGNWGPPGTAIQRQGIGGPAGDPSRNWLHREWEVRGGPTAGEVRAAARAVGLEDLTAAPLWEALRPEIEAALARRREAAQ